jgi:SAM-dependent methyltransferase
MKHYWTLGHRLPLFLSVPLFGDRLRYGSSVEENDSDWQEWQAVQVDVYQQTQKEGFGKVINDAGYRILRHLDLDGRRILELGPGHLPHMDYWSGKPQHYTLMDNQKEFLDYSAALLRSRGIPCSTHVLRTHEMPMLSGQFDMIITFYSLEHLFPLYRYLSGMKRLLAPGGLLVGAIPAEGGLAWGMGRFLTTRRYIRQNTSADPDKVICWAHPNFTADVLQGLDQEFEVVRRHYWPFLLPVVDMNLIISFIYRQRRSL